MARPERIAVLGAGSWGTTFAKVLADAGNEVVLWARRAEIAAAVFRPKPPPAVSLEHIHQHQVSVREHAALLRVRLAERGSADFSELVADCSHTVEIVARFLALLELYREQVLSFEQEDPLGELVVRWVGGSVEQAREQAEAARARDEEEEYG